jgi:hypothetical protein
MQAGEQVVHKVYIQITTCGKNTLIGYQGKIKAVTVERQQTHRWRKGILNIYFTV